MKKRRKTSFCLTNISNYRAIFELFLGYEKVEMDARNFVGGVWGNYGCMLMKDLGHDVGSNLYQTKKMRVGSLWNDLPWLHNDFQVGKV